MENAPSVYAPLGERDFRVLILHGELDGMLQCELKTLSLDTTLSYVALSYTWGNSDDTSTILLHGQRRWIQSNLAEALAQFHRLGHFFVWADALSINQEDVLERNSQVAVMRNIFEKAREVCVWLEEVSNRLDIPLSFIRHFCGSDMSAGALWRPEVIDELNGRPETLQLLHDVLAHEYWIRAWIIQEITIASQVNIVFGHNKVSWSYFESLVDLMCSVDGGFFEKRYNEFYDSVLRGPKSVRGLRRLLTLRHLRRYHGQSLLAALNRTQGTKQSDPRDAIYSKLGLASDSIQPLATLDYSRQPRKIYIDLVANYIQTKQRLDIICSAELLRYMPSDVDNLYLPSWVPDWRLYHGRGSIFSMTPTTSTALLFDAADQTTSDTAILRKLDIGRLNVRGFVLDEIQFPDQQAMTPTYGVCIANEDLHKPFQILAEVCRTLTADHLYTPDASEAESIPDRTIAGFVEIMRSYYGDNSIAKSLLLRDGHLLFRMEKASRSLLQSKLDDVASVMVRGFPLKHWASKCTAEDIGAYDSGPEDLARIERLIASITLVLTGRWIVAGRTGRVYLVPDVVEHGDLILILRGCPMPMLMRQRGDCYTVVGSCYADGIMHGEAMREYLTHSSLREFGLV